MLCTINKTYLIKINLQRMHRAIENGLSVEDTLTTTDIRICARAHSKEISIRLPDPITKW